MPTLQQTVIEEVSVKLQENIVSSELHCPLSWKIIKKAFVSDALQWKGKIIRTVNIEVDNCVQVVRGSIHRNIFRWMDQCCFERVLLFGETQHMRSDSWCHKFPSWCQIFGTGLSNSLWSTFQVFVISVSCWLRWCCLVVVGWYTFDMWSLWWVFSVTFYHKIIDCKLNVQMS
jgi:hypothetical protein